MASTWADGIGEAVVENSIEKFGIGPNFRALGAAKIEGRGSESAAKALQSC